MKSKNAKRISFAVIAVMLLAIFLACGKPKNLEEYLSDDAAKAELQKGCDAAIAQGNGVYSDAYFEVKDNTLTYYYILSPDVEYPESAIPQVKASLETEAASIIDEVKAMNEIDTDDPMTIRFIFKDAQGKEVINSSTTR